MVKDMANKTRRHLEGPGQEQIITIEHPETVNFDTPPSKLLDRLYKQHLKRDYDKVTNGCDFFRKLDPNLAYQRCPHFAIMLDEMLALAQQAGL
jgi:hypothetical protein